MTIIQIPNDRRYFIVKHGLDAFDTLPNYIWNTGNGELEIPRGYGRVRKGDCWVGFAYTTSDKQERPLSIVTGFFECVEEARFCDPPPSPKNAPVSNGKAWFIRGEPIGYQPQSPVAVKPIGDLLKRSLFHNQTFVPIKADEFETIREHTLKRHFDTTTIPLLCREPLNEQEVVALVANAHKQLGIERIIRIQQAFPDMTVRLEGMLEDVHLELEVYSDSFFSHEHHPHVNNKRFYKDNKPVAVLCWIDTEKQLKGKPLQEYVHKVFELQSLIREGRKIIW